MTPRKPTTRPTPPLPDDMLTRQQVAAYFGVTILTIFRWGTEGKLSPVTLGHRTVRYRRDDVLRLAGHSTALTTRTR